MGEIIRATDKDGFIKISVINCPDIAERARQIHKLNPVGTAALGRALCAASMMGEVLKEEEASLTLRLDGGGPLGTVTAVSDSHGNVRGYVRNPEADLPTRERDGKLDVGGAVGRDGLLTVSRDLGWGGEPYVSSSELVSGEIAEDLTRYLTESDQVGSSCGLGVLVDTDESVRAAGGFIVQLMPGAPDDIITQLEDNIFMMDQLTTILDEDGPEAVIEQVLGSLYPHITERVPVEYRCTCSRERLLRAVRSLSKDDIDSLCSDGKPVEASCRFCDSIYTFTPAEILAPAEEPEEEEE